jgi:hypothetical protein
MENKELVHKLREFIKEAELGHVPTEKIIYINNLLENGIIESFWNNKITKEKMDTILYGK